MMAVEREKSPRLTHLVPRTSRAFLKAKKINSSKQANDRFTDDELSKKIPLACSGENEKRTRGWRFKDVCCC